MIKKEVEVINETGLHARPATALVKLSSQFESDFFIYSHGYRINGKSILGVMTLAAEQGARLNLEIDGPDEQQAADAITELFSSGFKVD